MVNGDDVTWYEQSCGLGPEYDTPSSRLMIQSNPYELVALILAVFAIPSVAVLWDDPVSLSHKEGWRFSAALSLSVALVAAQRALYILYPHEFSTSSSIDVANLCVSGAGVALATAWAAFSTSSGQSGGAAPDTAWAAFVSGRPRASGPGGCRIRLLSWSRPLSRVLLLAAWVLDIQRRRGWMVGALGYTAILLLGIQVMFLSLDTRFKQVFYVTFLVFGGILLLSVQVLRPCHGYDE